MSLEIGPERRFRHFDLYLAPADDLGIALRLLLDYGIRKGALQAIRGVRNRQLARPLLRLYARTGRRIARASSTTTRSGGTSTSGSGGWRSTRGSDGCAALSMARWSGACRSPATALASRATSSICRLASGEDGQDGCLSARRRSRSQAERSRVDAHGDDRRDLRPGPVPHRRREVDRPAAQPPVPQPPAAVRPFRPLRKHKPGILTVRRLGINKRRRGSVEQ
jgi:hypothetical protein